MSQEEIDALLSATGSKIKAADEFPHVGWEEGSERRIDNYNFKEGQWIYIQWTRSSNKHLLEDDALYGFIKDAGENIFYHHFQSSDTKKEYLSADSKYSKDINSKEIKKVLAMFDPDRARKLREFGVNVGFEYESSIRLLIQGVSLNPYETGFGKIATISRFPQLYDMQRRGTLLLDKNYIKTVHGDVYLDRIDIRRGMEENNRERYLELTHGRLGAKLDKLWRETFDHAEK